MSALFWGVRALWSAHGAPPRGRSGAATGYARRVRTPLTVAVLDALLGDLPPARAGAHDRLADSVRQVSMAYNAAAFPKRWTAAEQDARVRFFLPRDLHKVAAALRDVDLRGVRRVLDLGAGVGASAVGAVLAVRAQGVVDPLEVQLVEPDSDALALARATFARLARVEGFGPVRLHAVCGDLLAGEGPADLVVLGQVLVEVGHGTPEPARVRTLARLLATLAARHLSPGGDGRLLVVEPALRVAARRLQEVRAALLERQGVPADVALHVVAPCPHDGPCPLLAAQGDWCHEDLAIDLPPALVPVARAAGLRWQGLTYARLVLARTPTARPPARVAAPPRVTRGKSAHGLCLAEVGVVTVERLDRHRSEHNAAWDALARGDGVTLSPSPDVARTPTRIGAETLVASWSPHER